MIKLQRQIEIKEFKDFMELHGIEFDEENVDIPEIQKNLFTTKLIQSFEKEVEIEAKQRHASMMEGFEGFAEQVNFFKQQEKFFLPMMFSKRFENLKSFYDDILKQDKLFGFEKKEQEFLNQHLIVESTSDLNEAEIKIMGRFASLSEENQELLVFYLGLDEEHKENLYKVYKSVTDKFNSLSEDEQNAFKVLYCKNF